MGLGKLSVQYLLNLRQSQKWDRVLTFGRLNVASRPEWTNKQLTRRNFPSAFSANSERINDRYLADDFFRALGAVTVDSLDASGFEGATIIHDLNEPVSREYWEQYDLVFDGGTTEHIFDYPMALSNAMRMVKVGGTFITHVPINCWCGHGFYQLSPELFFRVMAKQNGFKTEKVLIHGLWPLGAIYEARDPEEIRERVELISMSPMLMLAHARKISATPAKITATQSDYETAWGQYKTGSYKYKVVKSRLAKFLKNGWNFYFKKTIHNRTYYKKFRFPRE
ncbi:MAG TPA: hypothetical protein VGN23_04655 [Verrucomicrobiae bacterium]|jgi:hypothetical protein